MKKALLIFLMAMAGISLATTYHTLPFDGSISFAVDEYFATSTDTITAYCTWDDQYLYLGTSAGFLASPNDTVRSTYDLYYYIDTDPHPNAPTSGNGHNITGTYWTQIMPQQPFWFDNQTWTLPFNADFYIRGVYDKKDSVTADYGLWNADTQLWGLIGLDTIFANLNLDEGFYETRVPWDSLGNPTDIFILGFYVSNEWMSELYWEYFIPYRDVGGTLGSWPWSSIRGGDGDKNEDGHFDHWFHFHLQDGISPDQENDPPVVSDIPDQSVDQGESFAVIDLNANVFDDLSPDSLITWTYSGNTDLTVEIDANNQATVSPPNSEWTGFETITFTAQDEGGQTDQTDVRFTVNLVSSIAAHGETIPKHFTVMQNYPNPFNPTTKISYGLAKAGPVEITVSNILGQQVFRSYEAHKAAGYYSTIFNARQLPAGLYFYRISSNGHSAVKKMVIVK